ncbi:MAG: hypothetical protein WBP10_16110 [Thermoanaerobaculia bacterium]
MAEPADKSDRDSLALALRLLAKEIGRRLRVHPSGHLLEGGDETLEVRLRVPIHQHEGWLENAREEASSSLNNGLHQVVVHRAVFHPGHLYCLRCASPSCEHSLPANGKEVFAGYGPSGLPRFLDLGQWLLEQKDPRVDLLYATPRRLIAHTTIGSQLTDQLLPAFRDADSGYHIHGQVTAGWYSFPTVQGFKESLALSFQVVSSRPPGGQRRFGLNLIGVAPEDQPLENLFDRIGELPWMPAARWAQDALRQIERAATTTQDIDEEKLEKRLQGLLSGLARRLERHHRSRRRRTSHAQQRHRQGDRPTWKALSDLASAKDDDLLFDTRKKTLIVLGDRGRAHVFNQAGKLVTSIRYSPSSIERRRERHLWRSATDEEIASLREVALASLENEGQASKE